MQQSERDRLHREPDVDAQRLEQDSPDEFDDDLEVEAHRFDTLE